MSATCVPWYVLRSNTGLSTHGDPVFPHFCPLNQNLANVRTGGGGGATGIEGRGHARGSSSCSQQHSPWDCTPMLFVYGGALSAVQLFGRLAVLETHALIYYGHHSCHVA